MVGQELAGDREGDRSEFIKAVRKDDQVVCDTADFRGVWEGKGKDGSAPSFDFHHVADHLVQGPFIAAEGDDGEIGVDEGNRAVLHLAGRVAAGVEVRDLFKFEGGF